MNGKAVLVTEWFDKTTGKTITVVIPFSRGREPGDNLLIGQGTFSGELDANQFLTQPISFSEKSFLIKILVTKAEFLATEEPKGVLQKESLQQTINEVKNYLAEKNVEPNCVREFWQKPGNMTLLEEVLEITKK